MVCLSYLSAVRFSGPDADDFLQSQLSADTGALAPGECTFAAYCSPRGRVFGLLLVCRSENGYLVASSAELLGSIVRRLKMFILRSKVDVDEADRMQVLGLSAGDPVPTGFAAFTPAAAGLTYAIGDGAVDRDENVSSWKSAELLGGIAWLDTGTTEKFIPQMLGHDDIGALSFSKGCYPGQEIVARTRYLGKVKRKPLIVTVAGAAPFSSGSKVEFRYTEQSVDGVLIDSAADLAGNTVLFIVTNPVEGESPTNVVIEGVEFAVHPLRRAPR
jgi:folate-binding protein YgfZ